MEFIHLRICTYCNVCSLYHGPDYLGIYIFSSYQNTQNFKTSAIYDIFLPKKLIFALTNLAMSSISREQYDFQVINVRQDLVFSAVFLDFDVFNFVGYFMDFMKITILFHLTYFSSLVPIQSYFFARIVCSTYGSIINE